MPSVRIHDIEMNYSDTGRGHPVLLVHGFPLDHSMWRPQIDALSGQYRVLAPDLRGFGGSGATSGTVTMEQFADDLATFLDALKVQQPVALCGLSMGGYIAWQFWKRHRSRLACLILCDTRAASDNAETARGRLVAAEEVEKQGTEKVVTSMLGKLFAEETARTRPDLVETIRTVMRNAPQAGVAAALRGMASRADMTSELPQVDLPALVICGEHDVISKSDEMREIANTLPNARFVEIPNAGHMSPLEQPQMANQELQTFLANSFKSPAR